MQMKALQQYYDMVPFIKYVVLTFASVNDIMRCEHLNETFAALLSHVTIYFLCSFNFWSLLMKSYGVTNHIKPLW